MQVKARFPELRVRSDIFQFLSICADLRYRCLNDPKVGADLTDSGRLFHILGPK